MFSDRPLGIPRWMVLAAALNQRLVAESLPCSLCSGFTPIAENKSFECKLVREQKERFSEATAGWASGMVERAGLRSLWTTRGVGRTRLN